MHLYQHEILKWEAKISTLKNKSLFLSKSKISVSFYDQGSQRYMFIIGHSKVTLWGREISPKDCPVIFTYNKGICLVNLNEIHQHRCRCCFGSYITVLIHSFCASNQVKIQEDNQLQLVLKPKHWLPCAFVYKVYQAYFYSLFIWI